MIQYLDFRIVNSKKLFSWLFRTKIHSNMPVTCRGQLRTEHTGEEEHLSLGELTLQVGVTGILQRKGYDMQAEETMDDPRTWC